MYALLWYDDIQLFENLESEGAKKSKYWIAFQNEKWSP